MTAALSQSSSRERLIRWFGAMSAQEAARLVSTPVNEDAETFVGPPFDTANGVSSLRRALYFDQTSWLPDNLLERGDRMTMAASLEARMPFLDTDLVAAVSAFDDKDRIRGRTTKWVLRKMAANHLPAEIIERPKIGFRLPIGMWFRGPLRAYLVEVLFDPSSRILTFADRKLIQSYVDDHLSGQGEHEKVLWSFLALEIFLREVF